MSNGSPSIAERAGLVLARVIVPLWIVAGATLKYLEKTPKLLPRNIWSTADSMGVNLYWLLAVLIALEVFAVAVIVFLPRLSRAMAIFMLVCFCLILLGEIVAGHAECGCLGAYSPSPWVMLAIDGSLLLGVWGLHRSPRDQPLLPGRRVGLAAAVTVAGAGLIAARILPENAVAGSGSDDPEAVATAAAGDAATGQSAGGRVADSLPGYYVPRTEDWIGQRFADLDLARLMPTWPTDVDIGQRYVIFFSRSCSHCQTYFQYHFFAPPVPTTTVAIPESKAGFQPDTWLSMECNGCEELELAVGADWIITTPLVLALDGGVVRCAKEGDDPEAPECLLWH